MKRLLLLSTAWLGCAPAYAQSLDAPVELEAVVVTAERGQRRLEETAVATAIIDRETLQRRQVVAVSDALAPTPGVSVNRNGGLGSTTSVRIRGAEAEQTVVLIDGVKLNDPASPGGGFDFGNLLVGDIARIEVLSGPQSVLWGSQAIGGVVNLLTGRTAEVAPWLASHMDVNALDLVGAPEDLARDLEIAAAGNLKRVTRRPADEPDWTADPGTERLTAYLETKTVWHPIGI